ncbi:MAG: LytR/AlgR family response regulator transcription factor [Saprospiraceae bacterium]
MTQRLRSTAQADRTTNSPRPAQVVSLTGVQPPKNTDPVTLAGKSRHGVLVLPTMEGLCFERIKELVYLEASGNYTVLHFADTRQVLVCKTLRDVETMLPSDAFVRIHRSHCIHLQYIRKYVRGRGGHVVMENGTTLVVSSGQRELFFDAVNAFFG